MAGEGGEGSRSIEQTPTWAVAAVCLVFVLISILIEQAIHHIGHWLKKHHKKALYDALEKIKDELMLVGFISLLLTVGQKPISKICISKSLGDTMLPCKKKDDKTSKEDEKYDSSLLYCNKKGRVPLISYHGMHDLHIFIFVLAVFHVLYCVITMALGNAKMVRWKAWEQETKTMEYEYSHHPARFRFTRETTFGRRHMSFWTRTPILIWIVCFFRQFFRSVPKVDYLTLRHGFILAHLDRNSKFDFQKYIKRSLEDDFKVIVGISTPLWAFAVIFLLLNIHGWDTYFWLSFVPLAINLVVGTKLQVIITEMGLEIHQRHAVVKGTPVVHPSDKLFWFSRPHWVLYLIHFTLFQNAFQLAFFLWTWI